MMLMVTHFGILFTLSHLLFMPQALAQAGIYTFQVKVLSFSNPNSRTENGDCCDGSCDNYCEYYFIACLQEYNLNINTFFGSDSCPYGRVLTDVISENHNTFTSGERFPSGRSNVITVQKSNWPGNVQFGLRASDRDGDLGGDDDETISTVLINLKLFPGDSFTTPVEYRSGPMQIKLSFRVLCADNYYGCTCQTRCTPTGNFVCNRYGVRICADNYYGASCATYCVPTANYLCDENGQHVCADNYYGTSCATYCVPMTNYLCDENGQPVCAENYYSTSCATYCVPVENIMCDENGQQVCADNFYGSSCMSYCVPSNNQVCNETGQLVCAENYYGASCTIYCVQSGNIVCNDSGKMCTQNYYGSNCTIFCQDSDDNITGHYYCDDDGNRVCLNGYQNPSNHCVDCVLAKGCSPENGYCEEPYQCLCTEEYEGENCTLIKTDECDPNPCQNGGECIDMFQDYNCTCHNGFRGKNCSVKMCGHQKPCKDNTTCVNCRTDGCDLNPCQNNEKCTDLGQDFLCEQRNQSQFPLSREALAGVVAGGTLILATPVSLLLLACCIRRGRKKAAADELDHIYEIPTIITKPNEERAHENDCTYENVNPIVPTPNEAYHTTGRI